MCQILTIEESHEINDTKMWRDSSFFKIKSPLVQSLVRFTRQTEIAPTFGAWQTVSDPDMLLQLSYGRNCVQEKTKHIMFLQFRG